MCIYLYICSYKYWNVTWILKWVFLSSGTLPTCLRWRSLKVPYIITWPNEYDSFPTRLCRSPHHWARRCILLAAKWDNTHFTCCSQCAKSAVSATWYIICYVWRMKVCMSVRMIFWRGWKNYSNDDLKKCWNTHTYTCTETHRNTGT